ncbi:MAG: ATP-binding cassette domain-containing protein [Planctomycetia bacterium]|nr:ATP-binding cassette domain-containing protein [Planctomycetia bacterium]
MAQMILRDLSYALGYPPLLDKVQMTINPGEKIGLLGCNGAGKSTLLKLLNQELLPDSGEIVRTQGLKTMLLIQQAPADLRGSVWDVVSHGSSEDRRLNASYQQLSLELASAYESENLEKARSLQDKMDRIQHELELSGAWEMQRKVESILQRTNLDPEAETALLSAGNKRRVLFAQAVVAEPDILLLDEPTNHLDLESTLWMEEFLKKYEKTILFVTHDRAFLRAIATSIWELDRGRLYRYDCSYDQYLERREERLHAEEKELEHFHKKLSEEEKWIRTGIMARRTRNEGRVRALKQMRRDAALIRKSQSISKMAIQEGDLSGRLVIETRGISFRYAEESPWVVKDFSVKIMRGDRIGILGPNGVGKSTLLKLLLGELAPSVGSIRHGAQLQIAYYDQLHAILREEESVLDNVSDGTTTLTINGKRQHVLGYLRDFLFSEERAKMPVKFLSGGEKNRLLLAKLFTKPSNILVMDEPTNDLDMETLDLLEEKLSEYGGTLLLVSHDREFINHVATSTLVFEGEGVVHEYAGGYDDWVAQRASTDDVSEEKKDEKKREKKKAPQSAKAPAKRLTYMEQKELDALPKRIEELENALEQTNERMSDPALYHEDQGQFLFLTQESTRMQAELEELYARWEELDAGG